MRIDSGLLKIPFDVLLNVREFLDPKAQWELCKANKKFYDFGLSYEAMDEIITNDGDEISKKFHSFLRLCEKRWIKNCPERLLEICSVMDLEVALRKDQGYVVEGRLTLVPGAETTLYVRDEKSNNCTVIDLTKTLTEIDKAFLKSASINETNIEIPNTQYAINLQESLTHILNAINEAFGKTILHARLGNLRFGIFDFECIENDPIQDDACGVLFIQIPVDRFETISPKAPEASWIALTSNQKFKPPDDRSTKAMITFAYNLISKLSPTNPDTKHFALNMTNNPIYSALQNLCTKEFIQEGGKLAFGLQVQYPFKTSEEFCSLDLSTLKGSDKQVYLAAESLGLNVKLFAAFTVESDSYDYDYDSLEVTNLLNYRNGTFKKDAYFLSKILYIDDEGPESFDESEDRIKVKSFKATLRTDVVWVQYPKYEYTARTFMHESEDQGVYADMKEIMMEPVLLVSLPTEK
ncbi:hypothetical protein HK098_003615 [Nowakowskiella sp. JEL0407]|nr:hypothetical protein HK098_003615 [Nowakowskiella sp. JEL0407]